MNKFRALSLATIALASAVALGACSGNAGSGGMSGMDHGSSSTAAAMPTTAASAFNDADVAFARMMVPHHQDAVEMADVILAKDGVDQRVLDLAIQIKAAQGPEITQLLKWLTAWGADKGMSGMDNSMAPMDVSDLKAATGVDAAKMFLEQMKVHHQGAITMAQTERDTGANRDAKKMAAGIVSSQTAEISTIDEILATL